jgi:hypothetical protein
LAVFLLIQKHTAPGKLGKKNQQQEKNSMSSKIKYFVTVGIIAIAAVWTWNQYIAPKIGPKATA